MLLTILVAAKYLEASNRGLKVLVSDCGDVLENEPLNSLFENKDLKIGTVKDLKHINDKLLHVV